MPFTSCTCPVTKTLTVNFTGSVTPPAGGYIVKWKTASAITYNTVSPNPTSSPVTISVPACEDINVVVQSVCDNSQVSTEQTVTATKNTMYTCAGSITGSHTHNGYYNYGEYILDCSTATGTVSLAYDSVDKPNRFAVFDPSGNEVATSGWKGTASYSGPWGATLSNGNTGTLTFTPTTCWYKLVVESVTDVSFTDTWSVAMTCASGSSVPTPTITQTSCSLGYGVYRIDAPAGTTMRVKLSASGSLTNNASGYCAQLQGSISSSTGASDSEVSNVISTTGTASIGTSNTLYVDVTVPSNGYVTFNTTVLTVNSVSSATSATLSVILVNGTTTSYTQNVCVYNSTGTVSCGSPTYNNYYANVYACTAGTCSTTPTQTNYLVALPTSVTPVIGHFYLPLSSASEYGFYVYELVSTSTSGPGYVIDNIHYSTCGTACNAALPN